MNEKEIQQKPVLKVDNYQQIDGRLAQSQPEKN